MRIRSWMGAATVLCGLFLGGCGGADNAPKPPSDAVTDTPMIDIDEGIEASPDEVTPKTRRRNDAGPPSKASATADVAAK